MLVSCVAGGICVVTPCIYTAVNAWDKISGCLNKYAYERISYIYRVRKEKPATF